LADTYLYPGFFLLVVGCVVVDDDVVFGDGLTGEPGVFGLSGFFFVNKYTQITIIALITTKLISIYEQINQFNPECHSICVPIIKIDTQKLSTMIDQLTRRFKLTALVVVLIMTTKDWICCLDIENRL